MNDEESDSTGDHDLNHMTGFFEAHNLSLLMVRVQVMLFLFLGDVIKWMEKVHNLYYAMQPKCRSALQQLKQDQYGV